MQTVLYDHPLIKNKVALLRDKNTKTTQFRSIMSELSGLMCYEATKDLRMKKVRIQTPLCETEADMLDQEVVLVPILRAGLGMIETVQMLIPHAKIGHIGLYRDEETATPRQYYAKLPKGLKDAVVLVLDPMLATGGTVKAAVDILKDCGAEDIRFVSIVGCPEGLDYVEKHCPDVKVYLAALDKGLNEKNYIVPGLGDAGDRLFGTK